MEPKVLCQSCGIPLDNEALHENKRSKTDEYCKFC
jgi:hypothetical protein